LAVQGVPPETWRKIVKHLDIEAIVFGVLVFLLIVLFAGTPGRLCT